MIIKERESHLGIYQKRADGILVFRINPSKKHMSINDLSEQLETFLELQNGIPSPFLMFVPEIKVASAEEKKFLNDNFALFASTAAMVTNSAITKYFAHVFLYLYAPPVPTQVFTDEEKAIAWLNQQ